MVSFCALTVALDSIRIDATAVCPFCEAMNNGVPPSFLGFRNVGSLYWLTPDEVHPGEDHKIEHYMELLTLPRVQERVPMRWPR